mgnify:CR=1 FL=1
MLTITDYVKAKTLEEANELNQARNSRVMGGMMWMRLGNARVKTVIDLSELGLDQIEETDHVFKIGAMCTLRQLELHQGLREMYGDGIAECVRHIVGVQFRNQATVGGSIYGRFGFSDVLTALLALDTFVELYNGGIIRLSEFVNRKKDKDLLLSIIIRKSKRSFRYDSVRQTKTDFPVIACSVVTGMVNGVESWYFSVGARPMKAALLEKQWEIPADISEEEIREYAKIVASEFEYGTNMRGSAKYRQHLAEVLIFREMRSIITEGRAWKTGIGRSIRRYHTSGCIEKFRMLQCEMWVRDNKLRTLYSLDQWKIQTFLLDSGSRDRGAGSDDSGRAERGSRRVRCISCTGRCRTVWILLSGIYYECAGNGAGVRKSND